MPNTGIVNSEIVNGFGESYFQAGNIVFFRQVVQSVYRNQLVCNNVYNGGTYNSYAYNTDSINCFWTDYFIIFNQMVGELGGDKVLINIIMDVIYRSSGGGLDTALIILEQSVIYLRSAYTIIDIEGIVEDV